MARRDATAAALLKLFSGPPRDGALSAVPRGPPRRSLKSVGVVSEGNRSGVLLWPKGGLAKLRGATWPNPLDA